MLELNWTNTRILKNNLNKKMAELYLFKVYLIEYSIIISNNKILIIPYHKSSYFNYDILNEI